MNALSTTYKSLLFPFVWIFLFSCGTKESVDLTAARAEILALHNAQRDHHFNKDSIAFANQLSDNFISVNKGIISRPKREETISRYNGYFSSVEFVKWDDVTEPIIEFSDDGSMAYTIVDKIVVITYENADGEHVEGKTHFAWTAIYRKYADEWRIDSVTSTDRPPEN